MMQSLDIMIQGMASIFVVLGVIALALILIFTRIFRDKRKKKGSAEPTDPSSKQ